MAQGKQQLKLKETWPMGSQKIATRTIFHFMRPADIVKQS